MRCFSNCLLFLSMVFMPNAQAVGDGKPVADVIQILNEEVPKLLEEYSIAGTSIAIIENGEMREALFYGYADVAAKQRATKTTGYNIGSISKTVTSWGIMRLVEQGVLDLDAPIENYLTRWHIPPSDFDVSKVTIRNMLTHMSGLSLPSYPGWSASRDLPTLEESLNGETNWFGGGVELVEEPANGYLKSGGSYTILQLVIEEVSGQSFSSYMRDHILLPLGMINSTFDVTPDVVGKSAKPYAGFGPLRWQSDMRYFTAKAAAGMHSTLEDMAKFAVAVARGPNGEQPGRGVLKPETIALMTDPNSSPKPEYRRGLSYGVSDLVPDMVGHGGNNWGWLSSLSINRETGNGFVVLMNSSNREKVMKEIELCLLVQNMEGVEVPSICD